MDKTALLVQANQFGLTSLASTTETATALFNNQRSESTEQAYKKDRLAFEAWCDQHGLVSLPSEPGTVALFLASMCEQGFKPSYLERRLSAISQQHKDQGHDLDMRQARRVLKGYRRQVGTSQKRAEPLMIGQLKRCIDTQPDTSAGIRNKALLLIGWTCALRRSEIASLTHEDIRQTDNGLVITIRKSKTDQDGKGYNIGVPFAQDEQYCPVLHYRNWKRISYDSGPVFRRMHRSGSILRHSISGDSIGDILKQALETAGYDSDGYSGHSLRAGLATSAAKAGKAYFAIKNQTRHQSDKMLGLYVRAGNLFDEKENCLFGLL